MKESENNFSKPRIEKVRKEFNKSRYKFSKSKIDEIIRHLYETENGKNLFAPKIKEIERNLIELEENLLKPRNYNYYYNIEYKGVNNLIKIYLIGNR